jgi:hypothetical protein
MNKILSFLTSSTVICLIFAFLLSLQAKALSDTFDPGLVISDEDFTGLPLSYSSPEMIQSFLESKGSLLANYKTEVSFESDDITINPNTFPHHPPYLVPYHILESYKGREMSAAEIIWALSREDLPNGCGITYQDVCVNNNQEPLNPGFLLAMIQKESGLVYGANSRLEVDSPEARWLLDRVVGYYCFENPDKSKSCYDENPNWKYFKGFFRQLYYSVKTLRINKTRCDLGGNYSIRAGNTYFTGNTVYINNQPLYLKNGITCSLYAYTPHLHSQNLLYNIFKDLKIDQRFLPHKNYQPSPAIPPKSGPYLVIPPKS